KASQMARAQAIGRAAAGDEIPLPIAAAGAILDFQTVQADNVDDTPGEHRRTTYHPPEAPFALPPS
ncbi:hypothetical protein, partial [Accumulibacter sp.]|uniref:hypothetical protein n=1 Tax=Accumulibacter sp. TaxID=2053492 RepID=UPI002579AC21